MIVQQKAPARRQTWSFAPSSLAALVGGALLAGSIFGAVFAWQMNPSNTSEASSVSGPLATFDSVGFRAEERALLANPQATFDAVRFRAEEREPLHP